MAVGSFPDPAAFAAEYERQGALALYLCRWKYLQKQHYFTAKALPRVAALKASGSIMKNAFAPPAADLHCVVHTPTMRQQCKDFLAFPESIPRTGSSGDQ